MSSRATAVLRASLILGIALRLALCAVNPPTNAFDDHYKPIKLILTTGEIPDRDDCFECYHPPVFYLSSAWVAQAAMQADVAPERIEKLLQFLPCLYAILTLFVILGILRRLRLSDFAVCVAFAVLCFLPRHVYMAAVHSNDTIAYLGVSVCVWLILRCLDSGLRLLDLALLSGAMAITVVTKYTSMVVLPLVVTAFGCAWLLRVAASRRRIAVATLAICVAPLVSLALFAAPNVRDHGRPFPSNLELFQQDWLDSGRATRDVDFMGFRPWAAIATPILAPDNRDSLWTVLWARAWFDMEPLFLPYTDPVDEAWWDAYERYVGGAEDEAWQGTEALGSFTLATGRGLIALGLLPALLLALGMVASLAGRWSLLRALRTPAGQATDETREARLQTSRLVMMPVLVLGVMAGIVLTTVKFPYTFSMKSIYILNGLPAFIALVALGAEQLAERPLARRLLTAGTALLALLTTAHILHILVAMAGD